MAMQTVAAETKTEKEERPALGLSASHKDVPAVAGIRHGRSVPFHTRTSFRRNPVCNECRVPCNVNPMVPVVGVTRKDAAYLMGDHFEGFFFHGRKFFPTCKATQRHF